jgi:hypothetical protein
MIRYIAWHLYSKSFSRTYIHTRFLLFSHPPTTQGGESLADAFMVVLSPFIFCLKKTTISTLLLCVSHHITTYTATDILLLRYCYTTTIALRTLLDQVNCVLYLKSHCSHTLVSF